jgi:tetratricopeptide (TPR) repeat protein
MSMKIGEGKRWWIAAVPLLFVALQSGPASTLRASEPSEVMKQFLESSPPAAAGAHRQNDPHAGLSAEKMAQVALAHLDESRTQLAFETLKAAIGRYPENAMLLSIRASLLLQSQRTSEALADLNRALEINPHDPVLFTNRAQALRQFGRREDAMRDLDQALRLDPDFVAAHFNRGSLNFEAARFDQALADFDRCIELAPDAPAGYFNRAATLDALGERQRAITDLRHFLTLPAEQSWQEIAHDMLQQWDNEQS